VRQSFYDNIMDTDHINLQKSDIFVDVLLDGRGIEVDKIFLSGHAVKIMEGKLTVNL